MAEFLDREIDDARRALVVLESRYVFEPGVVGGGVAVVIELHAVRTDHVHADGVAVVLRSARRQEGVPVLDADRRPARHTDEEVVHIILILPQPNGETEVITNRQTDLHSAVLKERTPVAGREEIRFAAGTVEMMLVVILGSIVGTEDEPAVIELAMVCDHHRANDCYVIHVRHVLQRHGTLAVPPLVCQTGTVGTETGSEHLRHNNYIRLPGYRPQALIQEPEIRLGIRPFDGILH